MTEQRYLRIIRKWWWLVALAALFAGLVAYRYTRLQPTVFQASAKLIIGPGIDNSNPDHNTLRASGQLIQTYAELPKTGPFLQSIINDLNLDLSPDQLAEKISVETNTETQIMTIRVQDRSGPRAVNIANAVVDRLVRISPSGSGNEKSELNAQIRVQIANLERTIEVTEARIEQLERDLQIYQEKLQATDGVSIGEVDGAEERLDQLMLQFQEAEDSRSRSVVSGQILTQLIASSSARITALEVELQGTQNLGMRQLILNQIAQERGHLSRLQSASAEVRRRIDGMPLEDYIDNIRARITALEVQLENSPGIDSKRLIDDQITQERARLNEALQIDNARQQLVLEQLASERSRLSAIQGLDVEIQSQTQEQIDLERSRLADQQRTLSALYQPLQEAMANQAQVIEPAVSASPAPTQQGLYVLLAAIAELILCLVIIFAFEYWLDRVETPEDLAAATESPVLGKVSADPIRFSHKESIPISTLQPSSTAAQEYRLLGAKLLISLQDSPLRSILIGSPHSGQEANVAAANLAEVLNMAGKRVVLLDARTGSLESMLPIDLQDNHQDDRFEEQVPSGNGVKPALIAGEEAPKATRAMRARYSEDAFKLLASAQLGEVLTTLRDQADFILIVSPSLKQPESLFLATKADGVILVVSANRISRGALKEVSANLKAAGANVLGVVFKYSQPFTLRFLRWIFTKARTSVQSAVEQEARAQDASSLTQSSTSDVRTQVEQVES